ncbi:MAG: hypothetical protein HYR96_10935 [Deltaproteobacteria bacterium]|nr:hypothetical protein [Deltaproteobacteria bacterium]MBI3293957.1 hypothetical protein [Deltaproteobacteria bacterium]
MKRICVLLVLCAATTLEARRVGVLVVPKGQRSAETAERLVRRFEETSGVSAITIPPEELMVDPMEVARESLGELLAAQGSEKVRQQLVEWVEGALAGSLGPLLQRAALKLALMAAQRPDERAHWIDTALRIHPQLELQAGQEWETIAEHPEVGLEVAAARRRLWKQCHLKTHFETGAQATLNGFSWGGGPVLHPGPFSLEVVKNGRRAGAVVDCTQGDRKILLPPAGLNLIGALAATRRHNLDEIVVALSEAEPVRVYRVAQEGTFSKIELPNMDATALADTALMASPIAFVPDLSVKLDRMVGANVESSPIGAVGPQGEQRGGWYNNQTLWAWVGAAVVGGVASCLFPRGPVFVEGRIE